MARHFFCWFAFICKEKAIVTATYCKYFICKLNLGCSLVSNCVSSLLQNTSYANWNWDVHWFLMCRNNDKVIKDVDTTILLMAFTSVGYLYLSARENAWSNNSSRRCLNCRNCSCRNCHYFLCVPVITIYYWVYPLNDTWPYNAYMIKQNGILYAWFLVLKIAKKPKALQCLHIWHLLC